ncbi:heavy metal-associated isoprenylated plant protein 16-like [Lycium ferocissimum]|uniref:heavy metal-associated isoprenylated plant protein 16-like n=1 Tax=Lycium ferocissimum TaxID=112874 RepID=UPI002814ECDF|nr:heavy metal-associated isoprenylated plant protein 16-like [Lycium ferocissimum]
MKEKIVIDLTLSTDNCISKAMQIAVRCAGVISVNTDKEKGHLVVIGVGVDFFKLMKCIKKKFNCARIVSVEEVKPEKKPEKKPDPDPKPCCPLICPPSPCVQYYPVCRPDYDSHNQNCLIM